MDKRVVVIVGASKGIGLSIAKLFLAKGSFVIGLSRGSPVLTDANFVYVQCDVTKPDSVQKALVELKHLSQTVDVFVYCSGIAHEDKFLSDDCSLSWKETIETNLFGAMEISQQIASSLVSETGRVIFLGSISSFKGSANIPGYAVSKHALVGFVRSFSRMLFSRRITVNAVCPGFVQTEMLDNYLSQVGSSKLEVERGVPFGRLIQVQEIADAVEFLCSESAKNITGQTLVIDGGVLA